MNILVCGAERFFDRDFIFSELDRLIREKGTIKSVTTFCDGTVERIARNWVNEAYLPETEIRAFYPDHDLYREAAPRQLYGLILNHHRPDLVMAFGHERGPHRMFLRMAKAASVNIVEFSIYAQSRERIEKEILWTAGLLAGPPADQMHWSEQPAPSNIVKIGGRV